MGFTVKAASCLPDYMFPVLKVPFITFRITISCTRLSIGKEDDFSLKIPIFSQEEIAYPLIEEFIIDQYVHFTVPWPGDPLHQAAVCHTSINHFYEFQLSKKSCKLAAVAQPN